MRTHSSAYACNAHACSAKHHALRLIVLPLVLTLMLTLVLTLVLTTRAGLTLALSPVLHLATRRAGLDLERSRRTSRYVRDDLREWGSLGLPVQAYGGGRGRTRASSE